MLFSASVEELGLVSRILARADPQNFGFVTGDAAIDILGGSGLSLRILGEIWDIADEESKGHLSEKGLAIAVRLIGWAQKGEIITQALVNKPGPLATINGIPDLVRHSLGGSSSHLPPLSRQDKEKYNALFLHAGPTDGLLSGEKVRDIFMMSKLPVKDLLQIWDLADTQNRGALDSRDFVLGMCLIRGLLSGQLESLPLSIPAHIHEQILDKSESVAPSQQQALRLLHSEQVVNNSTGTEDWTHMPDLGWSSPSSESEDNHKQRWDITPAEKSNADVYFDRLDTQNKGYIHADVVVPFMLESKLPHEDLALIWDLANTSRSYHLSRDEFAVALHLIRQKSAGNDIPSALPPSLMPPSIRSSRSLRVTRGAEPSRARSFFDENPAHLQSNLRRASTVEAASPSPVSRHEYNPHRESLARAGKPETERLRSQMEEYTAQAQAERARHQQVNDALLRKNTSLALQLQDMEQSMHQVLSTRENTESVDALKQEITRLTVRVAEMEDDRVQLTQMSNMVDNVAHENESLKLKIQDMQTRNFLLSTEVEEQQKQNEELVQERTLLRARVMEIEEVFARPGSPNRYRQTALLLKDVTGEKEALKARVRQMEQSMERLALSTREHDATKRENRRLVHRVDEVQHSISELMTGAAESVRLVETLTEENNRLKDQTRELQHANTQLIPQRTLDELRSQVERLEGENSRLAAQAENREHDHDAIPPPAYDDAFVSPG